MNNQELVEIGILEILERHIEELERSGTLHDGAVFKLRESSLSSLGATRQSILTALLAISENTHFKLLTVMGEGVYRPNVMVAHPPIDHEWEVKYSVIQSTERRLSKESKCIFWLENDGKFHIPTKEKLKSLVFNPVKSPFKILEYFADNIDPATPDEIASRIGSTKRNVENQIMKIKKAVENNFGLSKNDFIYSTGDGYRLGKNTKISLRR